MGKEIAVQQQASTALATVTPFSLTSLERLIPDWIGRSLFDDGDFALPQAIPSDGPKQLRDVAQRFKDSLEERAVRTYVGDKTVDDLDAILGELRLRTTIRNESVDEQRARFRILREDCRNHPTEVVREACRAYAKRNKFYPSGYAELLPFIGAATNSRSSIAYRLLKAATAAEKELAERKRLADDPVDPAEVTALLKEMEAAAKMQSADTKRKDYSNLQMPSEAELSALSAEMKGEQGA